MIKVALATATTVLGDIMKDGWSLEEKFDGERLVVKVYRHHLDGSTVIRGYNRKGAEVRLPTFLKRGFSKFKPQPRSPFIFDGEYLDHEYAIFDIIRAPGLPTNSTLNIRQALLLGMDERFGDGIYVSPVAVTPDDKVNLIEGIVNGNGEGVVAKRLDSAYVAGKTPYWLKYKFTKTADVFVTEVDRKGKELAVSIGLLDTDGTVIDAGGLKIPNDMIGAFKLDDVVEVKYLYSTDKNKLYQPIFIRRRTDKTKDECSVTQLKENLADGIRQV
jgi:ATP-dependent DNA ligase